MLQSQADQALRQQLIDVACALHTSKLTVANSGNVSVRCQEGFLVTPSGVAYEQLQVDDIVCLNLTGEKIAGALKPSSEWRFHADIYQARPAVNAIVHAHSQAATALASTHQALPPFHYMVALFVDDPTLAWQVPCVGYATFGTQALSEQIMLGMQGYNACLMANHGLLATANSLEKALLRAQELESLCGQYILASSLGVSVQLLQNAHMHEAWQQFQGYGQTASNP